MICSPTLALYQLNRPSLLSAEASSYVVEAVFIQQDSTTKQRKEWHMPLGVCLLQSAIRSKVEYEALG